MYESFFGFTQRPFAAAASANRYFPGQAIETARQTLARIIDRAEGVGLLTGPAGTGKSLLCQVLAEQFRRSLQVALLASGQLCTRRALLQAILFELGLPFRGMEEGDLRLSLVDHLSPRARLMAAANPAQSTTAADNALLLIVDEAHTLPLRLLEELRLITNLVRNGQSRVRLVLAGGPQLEERFASPKLESFNQRVAARCYLEALDRQQTIEYVRQQIGQCGGQVDAIFTSDALDAIAQATDGIPRLINQVCDHVLLLAYAGGERQINSAGIEEAWADLQQLPTPWNAAQGAPSLEEEKNVVEFGSLDDELSDELPAAVPFRAASADSPPHLMPTTLRHPQHSEPLENLDHISAQMADLDENSFQPIGDFKTEVELAFPASPNPFHETFDHEEVVIDRYTSLTSDALANRPLVRTAESHEFAALLAAADTTGRKPAMAIAPATWPGGVPTPTPAPSQPATSASNTTPSSPAPPAPAFSAADAGDDDLIVIEEPLERQTTASKKPAAKVRRREYRQLFAQLRRG
ncbi:MAG TPA: AAA family ATPase [Pirellulales bacterium]